MKLKDMKVGAQLRLGLGLVFAGVIALGAVAWNQADQLWQETSGLYEHPLMVCRALGELKSDILLMHLGMKDLVSAGTEQERQVSLESLAAAEADANLQFDAVTAKYLGPRADIDDARGAFIRWNAVRAETVRLLREGKTAEAAARTRATGAGGAQRAKVLTEIRALSDFSVKRSDKFYADAQQHKTRLQARLWLMLGAILLLLLGASYFLLKAIREPLAELTSAMEKYGQGRLDARSRYASANEFGVLSSFFNLLADTVQREMQSKERAAVITGVMLKDADPRVFCRELLGSMLELTGSQAGAVYLRNDKKTDFEHFESIGLTEAGRAPFSASGSEGEFGAALALRKIQRVTAIRPDTRFVFRAVSGGLLPREIVTIPIFSGAEAVAMISLSSVKEYSAEAVRLLDDTWVMITARVNGILALLQLQATAVKMEKQNAELAAQNDEITEYNIELELQKKQLAEASRLKSSFLSNMSHELRTPLNSVIALSGVLSRRMSGKMPEEEYGYLEVIERNGKSLLSLINDILDLSRIESGREEISLRRFSVRELAAEVIEVVAPLAREKKLSLVNSVGEDLPYLHSDFEKCRHILQNIVSNAVKFTGEGRVEIAAEPAGEAVKITVTDTGIGIAAENLRLIFDEFRQADESTTRLYGGTGLGLSIAKNYAALLRGAIEVRSELGRGSVFTLTLPLALAGQAQAPGQHSAPSRGPQRPAPEGKGRRILVVEDSEPAVIQLKDVLEGQGYAVQTARNGREALERVADAVPDAMILDLMMPEVDGFGVLRAIRGAERTSRLPVIILTAKHVTREELSFIKGNHVHQLIQKGDINKEDLLAAVGKMVEPPAEQARPAPARRKVAGRPVVLVVEDNPDNMLTVRALLKDTCTVIEAADGLKGLEAAQRHKPDIVLMDISLPLMDGIAAFKALRAEATLRHIPVIALTARAMKGDHEEILAHGFDGYLSKPVDAQILAKTIRDIIYAGE
jgi:signal transduction histidine kinase/DNA-binding response OmpR family regulator/HAMP domain-containing protein